MTFLLAAILLIFLGPPARAGGPLLMCDGAQPYVWAAGTRYFTDGGSTGPVLSLAQADALTDFAFAAWTNVATSSFAASDGGALSASCGVATDITAANAGTVIGAVNGDGISILYDADGSIIADWFGAPPGVLGVASPEFARGCNLAEGYVVINLSAVDPGDAKTPGQSEFGGVFTHEIGHAINLGHSKVNGDILFFGASSAPTGCPSFGTPAAAHLETMYPFLCAAPGCSGRDQATPHRDDEVALSNLYPAAGWPGNFGTVAGRILGPDGNTGLSGANVIVRNPANPFADAVSFISGDYVCPRPAAGSNHGDYFVHGLGAGAGYVVFADGLPADGSGQGAYSVPVLAPLPGAGEEYWNGAAESRFGAGTCGDDRCDATTVIGAPGTTTVADIVLNDNSASLACTPTAPPTPAVSATPTSTPSTTWTPTQTRTRTATPTVTTTRTPSSTATQTRTFTRTATPENTATPTVTPTWTETPWWPSETPTQTATPSETATPTATGTVTGTGTPTATATATGTATPPFFVDAYVAYNAKASDCDLDGRSLATRLAAPWVICVDDLHLDETAGDDPENFEIRKIEGALVPAAIGDAPAAVAPGQGFLRFQARPGPQSVAPPESGSFPRAAVHEPRLWRLENALGTINVTSVKHTALLVPSGQSVAPENPPDVPASGTTFVCYKVRTSGHITDQTPESFPGSLVGRFSRTLEAVVADDFGDCAHDSCGDLSFPDSPAAGRCVFDLRKVEEICVPASTLPTESPRTTTAHDFVPTDAATDAALLCYDARLAKRIDDESVAALLDTTVGTLIEPRQARHLRRRVRDGNPLQTAPATGFPVPEVLNTVKVEQVCLPTMVLSVETLD